MKNLIVITIDSMLQSIQNMIHLQQGHPFYLWNNPTLCPSKRLAHDQGAVSTRLRLAIRRRRKKRKRQLQQRLKLFCFCIL